MKGESAFVTILWLAALKTTAQMGTDLEILNLTGTCYLRSHVFKRYSMNLGLKKDAPETTPPGEIQCLLVVHPGLDTPEAKALIDINPEGLPDVAAHRAAETKALTSRRIKKIIAKRAIQLTDYRK